MSTVSVLSFDREARIDSLRTLVKIIGGSLLMALASQLIIPLQPIPITLQTAVVMFLGATLGKKEAAISILLYLGYIALGYPVAAGGVANPLVLLGPKAGYYFGFVLQAYLVGYYVENRSNISSWRALVALLAICVIQLALGAMVLGLFLGIKVAIYAGFLPFLATELIKSCVVMRVLR